MRINSILGFFWELTLIKNITELNEPCIQAIHRFIFLYGTSYFIINKTISSICSCVNFFRFKS
jgi:hypothetical protein